MKVLHKLHEIYAQIDFARREGKTIGLVPTMGALHEGHYSLVRQSAEQCDLTVATIFVNPSQFGPKEDLSRYPRTLEQDLAGLQQAGADFVFVPESSEIYSDGHSTWVEPPAVGSMLEGEFRPGHYRGVATIVLKLFNIIPATIAYFGLKDYQQLQVIKRMVNDLNIPIRIEPCATVREPDGLAMSSRNRYLDASERAIATSLSRALQKVGELTESGETSIAVLESTMRSVLHQAGVSQIDYARVVDADTLEGLTTLNAPSVALIAARVGSTRLIDNRILHPKLEYSH
jgi:pantoate--beta-alanine ligase